MDTVPSLARVTLIGRTCSTAEVKVTSGGKALTSFRVRVDEAWKDRSGAQQVRSGEVPITWWGEHVVEVGQLVFIEARLSSRSYEARGETRYAVEVVVDKLIPLSGSTGAATTYEPPSGSTSAPASAPQDDSIPF